MKIERFEDILAWQEARSLVNKIYDEVKNNKAFNTDFRFRDQLTSSAVSIMANIAEGFGRRSNKEFAQFLFVAKGSLAELQSHLYVAMDQKGLSKETFTDIYKQTEVVAKLISKFITYLLNPK